MEEKPHNGNGNGRLNHDLIIIEDEGLREIKGFTQLPNFVLKHPKLSQGAKLAYALVLSYAWQDDFSYPAQQTLAKDLNCSRRQIIRYLQELRTRGAIDWKQQGLNRPNIYYLKPLKNWVAGPNPLKDKDVTPMSPPDVTPTSGPDTTPVSLQDTTPVSHKEYSTKNTQLRNVDVISKPSKRIGDHGTRTYTHLADQPRFQPSGLQRPTPELENRYELLVEDLATRLRDPKSQSRSTFKKIVSGLGTDATWRLLRLTEEAQQEGLVQGGNVAAYFVGSAKKFAKENGINLGLRDSRQA